MNQTPVIRNACANDMEALSVLAKKTYADAFGHSFSEADLAAHLAKNLSPESFSRMLTEDTILLAETDGRIVGYVQFGPVTSASEEGSEQELRRLYVLAEFQNQGYGGQLLEAALRHPRLKSARQIALDVWEHNPAAQRFYRRYGFEVIGTRPFTVDSGAETSRDLIMAHRSAPGEQVAL